MADRRRFTPLDFAIVAALAVLPVMLGVVWLVAVARPADPDAALRYGAHAAGDRYVSVRHVAALKTFEAAIVPRPTAALPGARQVLDGVPACRAEWGGSFELRRWALAKLAPLGGAAAAAPAAVPADLVAAQLGALDASLLRFSAQENARVERPLGLDAPRWFAAAREALARPIDAVQPGGPRFTLGCADLVAGLAALGRADAAMLATLTWRGTAGKATLARWPASQQVAIGAGPVLRRNPWSGVAGCIFLGAAPGSGAPTHFVAGPRSAQRHTCATEGASALPGEPGPDEPADGARWAVPPSLQALLQPLDALRQPSQPLYRRTTGSDDGAGKPGHRLALGGAPVDVGYSVGLTIDPGLQALAQKTAACYTGRHDVCRQLGMRRNEDDPATAITAATAKAGTAKPAPVARPIGAPLLEGAMVRMAAVAVIDVASGRIEALAGALSRCAREEVDGPGRSAACDRRLPYPVQYRPDALLNPAVFHDAMPASTIKPVMAAAFLADPKAGPRWLAEERAAMLKAPGATPARQSLRGELLRSDSARFLDRMFCFDTRFVDCRRPWAVQETATTFGWNAGCSDPPGAATAASAATFDCGKRDLLFGGSQAGGPATEIAYGRLLSEPRAGRLGAPMRLTPPMRLDAGIVARCASGVDGRRGSDDDWEKCRGGSVVDVVAEGWGQGHARASALGVAGMMAALAAAGNGQESLRRPHLVESVTRADGLDAAGEPGLAAWHPAAPQPQRLARDAAEVILSGLSYSHRAGTARSACEQVFDPKRCAAIGWLAGKTGTPSFPSDGVSLDDLARQCGTPGRPAQRDVQAKVASREMAAKPPAVCSSLRPYKWYVAAYRADGANEGPWTKAIAVLTERNWLQRSGHVHGAGDHGPNPSAEIAMQIAGRQVGAIAPVVP